MNKWTQHRDFQFFVIISQSAIYPGLVLVLSLGPYRSDTAVSSCGVPQGSILGPFEISSHTNSLEPV